MEKLQKFSVWKRRHRAGGNFYYIDHTVRGISGNESNFYLASCSSATEARRDSRFGALDSLNILLCNDTKLGLGGGHEVLIF